MKWIIADSGGTNTSWAYGENELLGQFETASLHPRNQETFPEVDRLKLQSILQESPDIELHFFGAGMSNPDNREKTRDLLSAMGFGNITIETDALAAGIALCGDGHGFAAILGTGSILLEMNKGEIVQRIGGLGPLLGDEGSGYYFGKLLVEWALEEEEWGAELIDCFGSRENLLLELEANEPIRFNSELAKRTADSNLNIIHRKNFEAFANTHLKPLNAKQKVLHVSGSYGFHNRIVLEEVLKSLGWSLGLCIAGPMDELIAFFRKKKEQKTR